MTTVLNFMSLKTRIQKINLSLISSLLMIIISFASFEAHSTTYYLQSGSPHTLANWNTSAGGGGFTPISFIVIGDVFIIDDDAATLTGNWTLGAGVNLQISSGASLDLGNKSITVGGTTSVAGTFSDGSNAGSNTFTGKLTVTGTFSPTGGSDYTFSNGITNNGGTLSIAGTGTITFNTNNQDLDGTAAISFGTGSSIVVTGITVTNKNTASVSMLRTNAGALSGTGNWTQGAGSTLNYYSQTLTLAGTKDFSTNANTMDYARVGGAQTIISTTYKTLKVSGGGATKTLAGAITVTNLDINTNSTILASDVYQITGNASGTFTMSGTSSLTLGNTGNTTDVLFPTNFVVGNITLSAGTVYYQNSSTQTVSPIPTYNNLTISTGGTKTVTSGATALSVNGTLTISAGTLNLGTTVTSMTVAGAASVTGTLNLSTVLTSATFSSTLAVAGTFTYNGTSTKTVSVTGNLSGAGTIDMSGGSLLHNLNLSGTSNTLTTLTTAAVASTVNYNALGSQSVISSPNYRNLTISGSGSKTLPMGAGVGVGGALSVTSGVTLNVVGAFTFAVSGNSTIAGTLAPTGTTAIISLQNLDLSGGQIGNGVTGTINILGNLTMPTGDGIINRSTVTVTGTTTVATGRNLTLNNSTGVKTFIGAISVQGTGTWTSTTLNTAASLDVRGGISNANTFTAGGITFSTNNQNISGAGTYTFANPASISGAITVTNQCTNAAGITFTSTLDGTNAASTWEQDNGSVVIFSNATRPFATNGVLDAYTAAETNTVYYSGASNAVYGGSNEYYDLTLNGSGTATLATASTIRGTLTLQSAIWNNTAAMLTMGTGSTIVRTPNGSLSNVPTFAGTVNVVYSGTGNVTTGKEMPVSTTVLNNLTINITPGASPEVVLNAAATVGGTLTLTSGIMQTTSANILTIANGGSATIGSTTSFINGPMISILASTTPTTLNFPIGKSTEYRPAVLSVTHSNATSVSYTAEMMPSDAEALGYTSPAATTSISAQRYWDISRTSVANLTTATVRLYYSTAGTNDKVTDYANLEVLTNNVSSSTIWTSIGGTATANGTGSILSSGFTSSFGKFTFGNKTGGTNALPINLVSFTAAPNMNKVNLKWTTATETNNDYFTIERSKNGIDFETVKNIAGAGNSTAMLVYSDLDAHPYEGISYYRLRQTDFDRKFSYSNIIAVEFKDNITTNFNIFPNPNDGDNLNFSISSEKDDEVLVVVYDVTGRIAYSKIVITNIDGENVFAVDLSNKLYQGVYTVTATSKQNIYSKRLIIK
jgi:fibronectin-binding autotransporter adhesin